MTITLRKHQQAAADAVEAAFRAGMTRPLVDMCVASGKSLTYAELARRELQRGGRALVVSHTRELVEQNASACRSLGLTTGINAAALSERTWRAPVISAAIQSVYKNAGAFGPITLLAADECHLWPHDEGGMFRQLHRDLGFPRLVGGSGTTFRLQGGSLIEGEGAPFEACVFTYSILDGIRDGYLCPAFSIGATEKIDDSKLRITAGEFTAASSDKQMLAAMDNHITQMVHHGWQDRHAWLVFEAGAKAAKAMAARMNEWGIPTGLVLGETAAYERAELIRAYRERRLRALVNIQALTTGFDVPHVDLLVMRRPTASLGLYIQMVGRALRCIGGHIESSIAAGKADCAVLDFAGNIDRHGPLDFIQPSNRKSKLVSCEECGTRNATAAARCWKCDAPMMKNCPACLEPVHKGVLDCPSCAFDMRSGPREESKGPKLAETPSGAALLRAWGKGTAREGGWIPIRKVWDSAGQMIAATDDGERWTFPAGVAVHAAEARWLRGESGMVTTILLPNGHSRSSARQITAEGVECIVPLPAVAAANEAAA